MSWLLAFCYAFSLIEMLSFFVHIDMQPVYINLSFFCGGIIKVIKYIYIYITC